MNVTLRRHTNLDDALDLAADLDAYVEEVTLEFRDDSPPPGAGERLLRRVLPAPEGVVISALLPDAGGRVGFCVCGPFSDPLVGDSLPMVLALWVSPDFRRRGLAREMVAEARSQLAARGLGQLAARAGHNDDALISMGERWGFVRAWELMVHEG